MVGHRERQNQYHYHREIFLKLPKGKGKRSDQPIYNALHFHIFHGRCLHQYLYIIRFLCHKQLPQLNVRI